MNMDSIHYKSVKVLINIWFHTIDPFNTKSLLIFVKDTLIHVYKELFKKLGVQNGQTPQRL